MSRPPRDHKEAYTWGVRDACHSMRLGALKGVPLPLAQRLTVIVDEIEKTLLAFLEKGIGPGGH